MKQIETMFERFLDAKKPLKAKWQIRIIKIKKQTSYDDSEIHMQCVLIKHYHHNMYLWDIDHDKVIHTFDPETSADKRGLDSIRKYLTDPENKKRVIEAARKDELVFKMQYDLDYIYLQNKTL